MGIDTTLRDGKDGYPGQYGCFPFWRGYQSLRVVLEQCIILESTNVQLKYVSWLEVPN